MRNWTRYTINNNKYSITNREDKGSTVSLSLNHRHGRIVSSSLLFQREALVLIPNENRNSYNSFLPTVGMLISAFIIGGAGYFIDHTQNMLSALLLFLFTPLALGTIFAYIAYHKKNQN